MKYILLVLFLLSSCSSLEKGKRSPSSSLDCEKALSSFFVNNYKAMIETEMNYKLSKPQLLALHNVLHTDDPIAPAIHLVNDMFANITDYNENYASYISKLIARELSQREKSSLTFARLIGQNELDKTGMFPDPTNNFYTLDQIKRKDTVLKVVGFSPEERFEIMKSKILLNKILENDQFDLTRFSHTMSKENAEENNRRTIEALETFIPSKDFRRRPYVKKSEANKIFRKGFFNPVASFFRVLEYDPRGSIGFCFGRAMTMHIEALRFGLHESSVRKIFVVGDLDNWQFHVATIVKGENKKWYVLDPFFLRAVTIDTWVKRWKKKDQKGNMQIYITNAERLSAGSNHVYDFVDFYFSGYKNYFRDLLAYYDETLPKIRKNEKFKERLKIYLRIFKEKITSEFKQFKKRVKENISN